MSRSQRETRTKPAASRYRGGLRELTMHELLGKSGRERQVERKKEPIRVAFAHCGRCGQSASGASAEPFAVHHRIKHTHPAVRRLQSEIERFFSAYPEIQDWRKAARRLSAAGVA